MTLVITTCTNRKRRPIPDALRMATLPKTELCGLAENWSRRLVAEPARFRAEEIYGGRGFKEAMKAAELLDARFMVVSAGLGLIDVSTSIPSYACTVLIDAPDSIGRQVTGHFSVAGWWRVLSQVSPFSVAVDDVVAEDGGLICAALSESYIDMIAADLLALPRAMQARLRIFTRAPVERVAQDLRAFVLPYDDRLDGPDSPHPGTRSDFAARALRHFAETILSDGDLRPATEHVADVATALAGWRMPAKVARARHGDAALLELIRANWVAEGGSSSRLLRRFRDELGIACEQGRFARLARVVRSERP